MAVSMYSASVPVFQQMLVSLSQFLCKAHTHANEKNIVPDIFLQARLTPDMFPLVRQVQVACDFAKGTCARLANVDVPSYPDVETTFEGLQGRIKKTLDFINALPAQAIEGSEDRQIVIQAGTPRQREFLGQAYLINYSLPHFFFHTTTAYAILRHHGVLIGKKDFVGA